jgi:membrane glycosyltransferase
MSSSSTPSYIDQNASRITRRRMAVFTFVVATTTAAILGMTDLVWGMPMRGWNGVILVLFGLLFSFSAFGASQALFGFIVRRGGGETALLTRTLPPDEEVDAPLAPTAIVMPIFNEDSHRVYAALRAMYRSVERTGQIKHFDFFILSDSTDPNRIIEEEFGWVELSRELNAQGRLFYRRRRVKVNKKAGNIADFCRRWGKRYRYMVVLDADSLMTGATLVRMTRLMERNPRTGIIQTAPTLIRAETLFARVLQFGMRLYGQVFLSGVNYWQQGEGNYWGHNAIIRLAPFMKHGSLPNLPGREPLGGKVLSHDFVEAALLRRAGWAVWILPDVGGSYEESPPTLIDSAGRDRRWCQGNLQHTWLLFARGLRTMSRGHLFLGIMSYVMPLLWFVFLLLGSLLVIGFARTGLTWVPTPGFATTLGITPATQISALFGFTMIMLFGPKILAVVDLFLQPGGARRFGGAPHVLGGVLLECLFSVLLAPILMLFHAKFVLSIVFGRGIKWVTQRRSADGGISWSEAARAHGTHTLIGVVWTIALVIFAPRLLGWMSPVLFGMMFSIPFEVLTSHPSLGLWARRRGLFCIPEELNPPREMVESEVPFEGSAKRAPAVLPFSIDPDAADIGLSRAVVDPYVNALHVCLLRDRNNQPTAIRQPFERSCEKLLSEGPGALSAAEKNALLSDAWSMDWLHHELWRRSPERLAAWWRGFALGGS